MSINELTRVRLKNGRDGTIVHVLKAGVAYLLDIGDGTPENPWDNIEIAHADIAEVIREAG
jgi:hypothetical protein